ncbi:hypothetical protein [Brevundimonas sp.]|uniref:hypothetical protein n=1 Tax=Brevundimonas sp. TaxID=1871086 RepID=UPI003B00B6F6
MKLKLCATMAFALSVGGCADETAKNQETKRNAEVDKRIESVKAQLNDPYSAKFSDLTMRDKQFTNLEFVDDLTLCGFVNVKNAYGAYVGPRRFAASTTRTIIEQPVSEDLSTSYPTDLASLQRRSEQSAAGILNLEVSKMCAESGYAVKYIDESE